MKSIFKLLILFALFTSCESKQINSLEAEEEIALESVSYDEEEIIPITRQNAVKPPPPPPMSPLVQKKEVFEKKIIKDGRIGIKVKNLEQVKMQVDSLVKKYDGYYANESFNNSHYRSAYNLKIRIPSERFEAFIAGVDNAKVELMFKDINARDVSEEYYDLKTRLKNKRLYLSRYQDLLKRAKSIKDILEIEEKIRYLVEEIESVEGQIKYLDDQVGYSTLNLTISMEKDSRFEPNKKDEFSERLKESLVNGWFGIVALFLFFVRIWPVWIVCFILIVLWRRYKRRKKIVN
ncbi:DUF4349 domain-containing protein [Ancylomarina sp.]|uniref:DUF4349 domain-containing protein n=1 Tax=Ancylomarina sp. TaxID=1970196 RepID=UPI003562775D